LWRTQAGLVTTSTPPRTFGSGQSRRLHSRPRPWAVLPAVAGGLFLAVMSTTLVSVALPAIGIWMRVSSSGLEWIVDAYVIVYSSLLVSGGAAGDRLGRKGLFLAGVAAFGTGSLVAGVAPSIGVLLAGRALQGLGPALLIPGSLTIIRALFEDERKRALAIGLWSTASGLALAVGPALGGLLVADFGWRAVFLFNVPLTALLIALAARYVPRLPRNPAHGRFDWAGAFLTVAAIAALAVGTIEGQSIGWTSPPVLAAFAAGAVALAGFIGWEARHVAPLVDVRLFAQPKFVAANAAGFVVFFAFVGAIVYFSAYFQQAQSRSALEAGLDITSIGIFFALGASASGRLTGRFGPRWPMIAGLVIAGGATLGLLRLGLATGIGAIWWNFALLGAGIGLCLTPMTTVAMSAADASKAGMVSAVHNACRQVGQVFGVSVLGALVYSRLPAHSVSRLVTDTQRGAFVAGLRDALWVEGIALFSAALLAAILFTSAPRERATRNSDAVAAG
jgi:MFS transporter, DHA2 family, methylenomycin A resistance protein